MRLTGRPDLDIAQLTKADATFRSPTVGELAGASAASNKLVEAAGRLGRSQVEDA